MARFTAVLLLAVFASVAINGEYGCSQILFRLSQVQLRMRAHTFCCDTIAVAVARQLPVYILIAPLV
jgi:hypothetical protein